MISWQSILLATLAALRLSHADLTLRNVAAFLEKGDLPTGVLLGQRVGNARARNTAAHDRDAELCTSSELLAWQHRGDGVSADDA